MRLLSSDKFRLLIRLSVLLLAGFLTTSGAGYVVSRDAIRHSITSQSLPLTGNNIYSEIQNDLLRPIFISSLMAQDTFVRDWVLNGERDHSQIVRYLKEVKQKYRAFTAFLVSERSHRYYYAEGILKTVRESDSRDKWYFRVRDMRQPYETNVDPDMAYRDTMTIFINYRVLDYQGRYIGATGVGLTLDTLSRTIENYQQRFQRRIYFVDQQGNIVLAGKSMQQLRGSISQLPGIRDIAKNILNRRATPTALEYELDHAMVLVNSRFIPELGWYLVVEQDESSEVKPIEQVLAINLAISAAVTLLVLAITLLAVNRYQLHVEHVAATDMLTGLLNRQAFEEEYQDAVREVARTGRPLCVILFDIDFFKQVNDSYGHLAGDQVIRDIGQLAQDIVRQSDVAARWGGEEFLILLKGCPLEQAVGLAEKLRHTVAAHDFGVLEMQKPITVSAGVAQYHDQETQAGFFARVDKMLYQAKKNGRNRVESTSI